MALFEKPETPAFDDALRQLETSDKAHATLFNTLVSKLFVNTLFLKKKAEENITAIDAAYQNGNAYTDQKIADLINGAPTTLDTLKEISDALATNDDVVATLNAAVGERAKQTELDTHTGNTTVHITASERTKWNEITQVKADTAENKADIDALNQSLQWKSLYSQTNTSNTNFSINFALYNEIKIEVVMNSGSSRFVFTKTIRSGFINSWADNTYPLYIPLDGGYFIGTGYGAACRFKATSGLLQFNDLEINGSSYAVSDCAVQIFGR